MNSSLQVVNFKASMQSFKDNMNNVKLVYDNRKAIAEILRLLANIVSDKQLLTKFMKKTQNNNISGLGKKKSKKGKDKGKGKSKRQMKGGAEKEENLWGKMVPKTDIWGRTRGARGLELKNAEDNSTRFHPGHSKINDVLGGLMVIIFIFILEYLGARPIQRV